MAAALDGLEIIGLAGLDGSQSGASAGHVHDEGGQFGAGHVGNAFLHEADARGGGGGHDALAGSGAAIDHVDGCNLTFGLEHHHAGGFPGFLRGQGLQDLRLRRDRVAEISVATAADGGMGNGFIAFHQGDFFLCHDQASFLR